MANDLILRYTLHEDGAHLVQALGDTPCPVFPDAVEGIPFTQINAYAFSESVAKIAPDGPVHTAVVGTEPAQAQPLAGRALQTLHLPAGIRVLQSACFYDCRQLTGLSLGPHLRAIGSDLFTNCSHLVNIEMRAHPGEPTGLKRILGVLLNDLRVSFKVGSTTYAVLRYPEYWEELEENAPAHIFNMGIHGQGYQYRQCFSPDAVNFTEYDRSFHPSLAEGDHTLLGLLALDRLKWPYNLSPEYEAEYRDFLTQEGILAAKALILDEDTETLGFFCGIKLLSEPSYAELIRFASEKEKSVALALLMEQKRSLFGQLKKSYSFDF